MVYTSEQILLGCPEKWNDYIFVEWTIREAEQKLPFLFPFIDSLCLSDLEIIQNDFQKGKSDLLHKLLRQIYFNSPRDIHFLLKKLTSLEINLEEMNNNYPDLLQILIKQNSAVRYLIAVKGKDNKKLPYITSLDIYDSLLDIIHFRLVEGLTFLNYKDKLTYSQLEFFQEKISNFKNKEKIALFETFLSVLGVAFGNKQNKASDFVQNLLMKKEDKNMSEFEKQRRIWFHDKWDDKDFVAKRVSTIGMELSVFYPKDELPEGYKENYL